MRTDCSQDSFEFGTVEGHRVVGAFDGGQITSHAGGLLLGASNREIRLIERLARCFKDGRDPEALLHTVPALLGQRIFGIALGYEDVNDHDHLRHDPVLQVLAGKLTPKRLSGAGTAGRHRVAVAR
jgi:Transposase DDE domain group 1